MLKYLIAIAVILALLFYPPTASKAYAPEMELKDKPITEIVKHFADVYGYRSDILLKVMECESHNDQTTIGDGGRAIGIFQIHKGTWERFTKAMGEELDRYSAFDQAKVAAWAFANGHAEEWTTYVAIKKGGTYSFYSKLLQKHFTVICKL